MELKPNQHFIQIATNSFAIGLIIKIPFKTINFDKNTLKTVKKKIPKIYWASSKLFLGPPKWKLGV